MKKISVELPQHRYDVIIESGSIAKMGEYLRQRNPHSRCALFGDERVMALYAESAVASLQAAGFDVLRAGQAPGEEQKNLASVSRYYELLLNAGVDRQFPVVSLGGGVAGDTVGFVAATVLRGVPFVQCPTSLLAMVDESVGGKVGVNAAQGKNLIGSFYQPELVLIDPLVLKTLPEKELSCGLAECIKHGFIADRELFSWTEANVDKILGLKGDIVEELLARNIAVKAGVVAADERESGIRAHLNFGHTFAHAIERCSDFAVPHGEAVGLGMLAATALSLELGEAGEEDLRRLRALVEKARLPTTLELPSAEELLEVMKRDKKTRNGKLRLVLSRGIGEVFVSDAVETGRIKTAWDYIRKT